MLSFLINLETAFELLQKYNLLTWTFVSLIIFSFLFTAINAACSSTFGIVKFFSLREANLDFPEKNETYYETCYLTLNINILQYHDWLDEAGKNIILLFRCVRLYCNIYL